MPDITKLAEYGPWGIMIALILVIAYLVKSLTESNKESIKAISHAREITSSQTDAIKSLAESHKELKTVLMQILMRGN
jgi:hypothetical protein